MSTNFDLLLNNLHSTANTGALTDSDNIIEIDSITRQFNIPEGFNTTIAYEGDVNSQIITFLLPEIHEGHILKECDYKQLHWKNQTSGLEGISTLVVSGTNYKWEVPPAAFTQAGNIEITITIYDVSDNGELGFSWNTATYTGFTVEKNSSSIGVYPNTVFPAKDEILFISKETKNIIAPIGYNNIVCNYGDIGIASVYFLIDKYLGSKKNLDVSQSDITIYVGKNDIVKSYTISEKISYTAEIEGRNKEGLIFFEWIPPEEITSGDPFWIGPFDIYIRIQQGEKVWNTGVYKKLTIADIPLTVKGDIGEDIYVSSLYNLIDGHINKGQPSGVASLNENGQIPTEQLPSYVDDVLEFEDFDSLPNPGEMGKIYITIDTKTSWRWSGTQYIKIGFDNDMKEELKQEFLAYFLEQEFIIDANEE